MNGNHFLKLYLSFKDDWKAWLDLHHKHFSRFVTLIVVILAVTLTAAYQFIDKPKIFLTVSIGPIINILLAAVGIALCDRFYRRFLEHEAISNKFFSLYRASTLREGASSEGPTLPPQSELFPSRWPNAQESGKCMELFVESRMGKGSNRWIRAGFIILLCLNAVVLALLVVAARGWTQVAGPTG